MHYKHQKAFTMIELVFVIVVIGILAAIAIPKLAATRDDAVITKARATVASVRSSLSTERQLRILKGDFTGITDLGDATYAFNKFSADKNGTQRDVLEYPIKNCASGKRECWNRDSATQYTFKEGSGTNVVFTLSGNKFNCTSNCSDFD